MSKTEENGIHVPVFKKDVDTFLEKVVPENASDIQIGEMRKAFISGAELAVTVFKGFPPEAFLNYVEQIGSEFDSIVTP